MRTRILLLSSLILGVVFSKAQKYNVTGAFNLNYEFKNSGNCEKAKSALEKIDMATKDEKTKAMVKTWYYRGTIYYNIIALKKCSDLMEGAVNESFISFKKALALNFKDENLKKLDLSNSDGIEKFRASLNQKMISKTFYKDMIRKLKAIGGEMTNKGYVYFSKRDFKNAYTSFKSSDAVNKILGKIDTHNLYNMAIAASQIEKTEQAKNLYVQLVDMGYNSDSRGPQINITLARIYLAEKNIEKFNEVLERARKKYPKNKELMLEQLNYLIKNGKSEEAMKTLNQAIQDEPENSTFYGVRGKIYNELKKKDEALKDFQKAISLDEKNYEAIYDLFIYYFNVGADKINESNDVPLNQKKRYDELKKQAMDNFNKAIGYGERGLKIKPSDTDLVQVLLKLYSQTKQMGKHKELKAKYY